MTICAVAWLTPDPSRPPMRIREVRVSPSARGTSTSSRWAWCWPRPWCWPGGSGSPVPTQTPLAERGEACVAQAARRQGSL